MRCQILTTKLCCDVVLFRRQRLNKEQMSYGESEVNKDTNRDFLILILLECVQSIA